jgi:hypothetical protein
MRTLLRAIPAIAGLSLALGLGCCRSATVPPDAPPPEYDSAAIARAAVQRYDRNSNGTIEGSELTACPALKSALSQIDTNGDQRLSAEELRARVALYAGCASGLVRTVCVVRLDGAPLPGAVVTFTPEPSMAGPLRPATATTDGDGRCHRFAVDGTTYPGLAAGLYTIAVHKEGVRIPARYNRETTLGREVVENPRAAEVRIELSLTAK